MIKIKVFKMLLMGHCLFHSIANATFFDENSTGWHWYQNQELIQSQIPHGTYPKNEEPMTATEIVNQYKKELEGRLHTAWVNPSFNNLKSYQELQKDMMDRAERFSDTWMKVVYHNAHLDHTLITPVNHKARHLYFDQKKQSTEQMIKNLAQEYGLFFIFDSRCRFCQEFSPTIQMFSKTYHWEVISITADGGALKEFPRPLENNGIIQKWKVEAFPALFAVNPHTEEVIPIAYGMASIDEIESRIMLLSATKEVKK